MTHNAISATLNLLCLMMHSVVISNIATLMVFCILNDTLKPKYFSFKIEFQGRKGISKKFDSIYTKCADRVFCFEQYTENFLAEILNNFINA